MLWLGLLGLALVFAPGWAGGCGEKTVSKEEAEAYITEWAPGVEAELRQMAVAPAGKKDFEQRLKRARNAQEGSARQDSAPYDVFVDEVYAEIDYEFRMVEPGALTERGQAVWDALQAVDEHGLKPDDYPIDELVSQIAALQKAGEKFEALASFEVGEAERGEALDWLSAQLADEFELSEESYSQLTERVLESSSGARMKERLKDYESLSSDIAGIEAEIEQLLAQGVVRYARQMKHFRIRDVFIHRLNFDRWNDPNIEGRRPDKDWGAWRAQSVWRKAGEITDTISEENETDILYALIQDTLRDVLNEDAQAALAELEPAQPQYAALKKEYLRYREIAQTGGWPEVKTTQNFRKGQRDPHIETLKKRLQVEEYYPATAPLDDVFDDALEEAISWYQQTHQMDVSGRPHRGFWSSLSVPAARRAEQIALNLGRWRASNVDHGDQQYVLVNIPDFSAEVWTDQKQVMRFGVVVGNNETAIDEETNKKYFINHTPEVSAYIDRINYNPYWVVTPRIRRNEILPDVRESVEAKYQARIERLLKQNSLAQPGSRESAQAEGAAGSRGDNSGGQGDNSSENKSGESAQEPAMASTRLGGGLLGGEASGQPAQPSADAYWSKARDEEGDLQIKFDLPALKKLLAGSGDSGASDDVSARLESQFFYLDQETGMVDVSLSHKDHIPKWYEEHNYEVMFPGNERWEYVRELPGPKNSLGKVKVIFPNMHDIYLHDTPAKGLFRQDIRAYSHGCVRMEDPLGFSEYLLKQDGQWDDFDVPKILEDESYEVIFFKRQIPVHVYYITVRADDDGRANFLADIYGKDKFDEG